MFIFSQGMDACEHWMVDNDVNILIRSHQCVQFGYEKYKLPLDVHNKRCVYTIFSSANYRGSGNEGAVLILSPPQNNSKNEIAIETSICHIKTMTYHIDDIELSQTHLLFNNNNKSNKSNNKKGNNNLSLNNENSYKRDVIKSIFTALDRNRNGVLSLDEIRLGLQSVQSFNNLNNNNNSNSSNSSSNNDNNSNSKNNGNNSNNSSNSSSNNDNNNNSKNNGNSNSDNSSNGNNNNKNVTKLVKVNGTKEELRFPTITNDNEVDLKSLFATLDADGNGEVSLEEFTHAFVNLEK